MKLAKYTPFSEVLSLREAMDRLFNESFLPAVEVKMPKMDVYQTENEVVVETPLPGIDPEKVDISVEDDVLTLRTEKREEKKEKDKKKRYYLKEISYGSLERSISLPVRVKAEQAKAEYKKGVLKIVLPKAEEARSRKIKIEASEN